MAGKGGGAWKVAYADFVTAMMAFFMVMWLISQNEKVKEAVAKHFREPLNAGQLLPPEANLFPKEGAHHRPDQKPDKGDGQARPGILFATDRGSRTGIGAIILFEESAGNLSADGLANLDELIPHIAGRPQKIEIRGHASLKPLPPGGPYTDSWQLCFARSMAVKQHFEERGIAPERIRISLAGPFEPFTITADPDLVTRNSCVEVFLLAELTSHLFGTQEERDQRFVREGQPHSGGHDSLPDDPADGHAETDQNGAHAESAHDAPAHDAAGGAGGEPAADGPHPTQEPANGEKIVSDEPAGEPSSDTAQPGGESQVEPSH